MRGAHGWGHLGGSWCGAGSCSPKAAGHFPTDKSPPSTCRATFLTPVHTNHLNYFSLNIYFRLKYEMLGEHLTQGVFCKATQWRPLCQSPAWHQWPCKAARDPSEMSIHHFKCSHPQLLEASKGSKIKGNALPFFMEKINK